MTSFAAKSAEVGASSPANPLTSEEDSSVVPVRNYQIQDRYTYGAKLLELALGKLDQPFNVFPPYQEQLTEARGQLLVTKGKLDIQWMSTTPSRESESIPIKILIYPGILGLRLMLANRDRSEALRDLRSIEDLRAYKGVHGEHWGDLPVYAANKLPVITHVQYETLFELVKKNRGDYFHRGLNEIWAEADSHKNALSVADNTMLYYPLPVYYLVSKKRPELAQHLEIGLTRALEDGSFKKHFLDFHQDYIDLGGLDNRTLITLSNPDLPSDAPEIDTSWWLNRSLPRND